MAGSTNFPGALDNGTTLPQPGSGDTVASVDHAQLHDNVDVAIIATQTKLGTGSSTSTSGTVLRGNGTGTSTWAQANLTTDVTGTLPVANGGSGVTAKTGSGNLVLSTSPTLQTPVISSIVNTGTLTLPTSSDTLVGRATTDTLTNKTMDGGSNTFTNLPASSINFSTFAKASFFLNGASSGTCSSTSYIDIPNNVTTITLTKVSSASNLRIDLQGVCYSNGTAGKVTFGVNIDGTDYDIVGQYFDNAYDRSLTGFRDFTGLSAASHTIKMRIKIAGSTTVTFDANSTLSLIATEH